MMTRSIAVLAAALGLVVAAGPLSAQETGAEDQARAAYLAAYNQLGILEYCASQGYVPADAVELQSKMMALLPTPPDPSGAPEAQETGRQGTIAAGDQTMDITGAGTAETICKEIGDAVTTAAAGLPSD